MNNSNVLLIDENLNIGGGVRTVISSLVENSELINYYYWMLSKKKYDINSSKLIIINSILAQFKMNKFLKIILFFYSIIFFFKIRKKIDLIYVHQPYSLFVGYTLSKIYNKKLVYHCHGLSGDAQYNNLNILYKYTIRKVKNIIAISEYVKKQIQDINKSANISFIHNGLDISKIESKFAEKEYDFIFVGRINKLKDPYSFISSLQEYNKFKKAIIIGKIESKAYYNKIKELIKGDNKFDYLGVKEYTDTQVFIAKSKYIIVPSNWNEPFGMVVLEGFKNKTLVIARRDGGIGEIIDDGVDGFLYDNNKELLDVLKNLKNIDNEKITTNAFQKLVNKYSHQNEKLERILYSFINEEVKL